MLERRIRPTGRDEHGGGGAMTARTKRIVLFIVLAFVLYAVVESPTLAADKVQTAFEFLASAVRSVFAFFGALLR
jgi:hypothetical protein